MQKTFLAAALASLTALPALGATAIGLAGERTLVMIDPQTAEVTGMRELAIEGRMLGIDYRPALHQLIGVTEDFRVVSIDPQTGAVETIVQMERPLPIAEGAAVIVDINPAADALRFMSGTVNHRVNLGTGAVMVDGALHFDDGTQGEPMVGATAYSNAFARPEATAMYNIDTMRAALLRQSAPNDGTNRVIGMTGAAFDGPVGFDIGTDAEGKNTAWLAANGALHQLDLENGAITGSWAIAGLDVALRDLTIWPAMD